MGWSDRFAKYLKKNNLTELDAVVELREHGVRASQSQVHYWKTGSRPRDEARDRIEAWTKGAVPANLTNEAKSA